MRISVGNIVMMRKMKIFYQNDCVSNPHEDNLVEYHLMPSMICQLMVFPSDDPQEALIET